MPNGHRLDNVEASLDRFIIVVEISFLELLLNYFSHHVLVCNLWCLDLWEHVLQNVIKDEVVFENELWFGVIDESL